MKKRYILKAKNQPLHSGKVTAWLAMLVFISISVNAQKTYVPASIPTLPGLFSPNPRILMGDFDGDGDKDILYQNGNVSGVDIHYLRNNGNLSFTQFDANGSGVFPAGTPFNSLAFTFILDPEKSTTGQTFGQRVFDYDGDGDQDILELRIAGPQRILLRSGAGYALGVLSAAFPATLNNSVSRWVTADMDDDGDEDILYQSGNVPGVGINLLRNNLAGSWTLFAVNATGTFTSGPLFGVTFTRVGNTADITQFFLDVSGDGNKDLYELTSAGNRYFIWNGVGYTLTPTLPTNLLPSQSPLFRIVPGDYNQDGDVDFLFQTSNVAAANISYLRNNNNGSFTRTDAASGIFGGVNTPFGSATFNFISRAAVNREQILMDLDGDADLDMLQLGTIASSALLQTGVNLPIKLEFFTVAKRGTQVQVSWKTSEEFNVDYFAIEHSVDAINFRSLNATKSKGNPAGADYGYVHPTPVKGLQYYRLVEYDLDGSKTFFPIKSIQFDELKKPIEIYPNIISSRVTAYFKREQFKRVQLLDQMGRIVQTKDITNQQAEVSLNMSTYASGIYYLKFIGEGKTITEKILKR
ncbi:MAG TPA: T9SS type A sorting domain-containing protein [Chitinophagaceae bacterium]|nr:T9SS type A sorting domain-containing protein [Chitinophagaceae bacterium]